MLTSSLRGGTPLPTCGRETPPPMEPPQPRRSSRLAFAFAFGLAISPGIAVPYADASSPLPTEPRRTEHEVQSARTSPDPEAVQPTLPDDVRARLATLRTLRDRAEELRHLDGDEVLRLGPYEILRPGSGRSDLPTTARRDRDEPAGGDADQTSDPVARRGTTSTWEPYAGPFGRAEAAHLLHRTVIGATWEEIENAASQGLDATIDQLLTSPFAPIPPGPWATEPLPDVTGWSQAMIDSLIAVYNERGVVLRGWWPHVMVHAGPRLTETMTHFWHDHFATSMEKVFYPQSMYVQNRLLRQQALGNFKELTLAVSLDPAMLLWLDNQYNYEGYLNENFARELLELFTLGVGHYTQEDIVETARAFTGYVTFDGVTSTFVPQWHDDGIKTILGQTGNWDADDVIEIVFAEEQCARFLCTKLYRWFVDEYPDPARIEELAGVLRENDYEMRPVLETMLRSEHFFDPEFRGSLISDGVDHYVGRVRTFGLADQTAFLDSASNQRIWLEFSASAYNHLLLLPPNVAGWPGYRTWINSSTLPWRKELSVALVDGQIYGWPMNMQLDALALGGSLSDPDDPYDLIDDVSLLLFGLSPTELVRQRMLDELLQGAEPWEWEFDDPSAEARIQGLVRLALRLPDAQSK